jgi:hypothetical protein
LRESSRTTNRMWFSAPVSARMSRTRYAPEGQLAVVVIFAETDQFEQSTSPVVVGAELQAGCAVPTSPVKTEYSRAPVPP